MVTILYNSFSKNGRGHIIFLEVANELKSREIEFSAFKNNWPDELGADDIWIIGGDGTLNYFLNKYKCVQNFLSIFPGGTGNDLHWSMYGDIGIKDQINLILTASPRLVDIARCNDKYFINMVGLGFDGAVLKGIHQWKWLGGHLAYLVGVVISIFTYKEKVFNIEFSGIKIEQKKLLCLISNASRTGGGFKISPLASITDGKLNLILCEPMPILERLFFLAKVEKGRHIGHQKVRHFEVVELSILCEQEVYYQLDGELLKDSVFDIKIIKGGLNFLF